MRRIDLNCDLGEARRGTPRWSASLVWDAGADPGDTALLDVVTSANVACGFHAGNRPTMTATAAAAAARGVALGAHPSYRDAANFGRTDMALGRGEVAEIVHFQVVELDMAARRRGTRVRYVKPHGALYNRIAWDEVQAAGVVDGVLRYAEMSGEEPLPLLGLPGSAVQMRAAAAGIRAVGEAFADRGYRHDGSLVPRGEPGAVLTDPAEVAARVVAMAAGEAIPTADGSRVRVAADSVCVHGDTPGALELARGIRAALDSAGVEVAPFVPVQRADGPVPRGDFPVAPADGPVPRVGNR